MSYWTDITTIGSGSVDYRLMVEGWPHEWVTSPRITHATGKTERLVYPGLQYTGLKISERVILREAWPQVQGITVTIAPSEGNEDTVSSFTRDAVFVANLGASIDEADTTWTTLPATLPPGIYHLATEAVSCGGDNTIVRGHWDTGPQKHAIESAGIANPVPIYSWPPTMEGRRAYLYAYGTSDDGAGDGTVIWRGVVVRPPRMNGKDALSWSIAIDPITSVFDQNVGGGATVDYRLRGIYHSSKAPMTMWFKAGGTNYPATDALRITGFFEDEGEWFRHVNEEIKAAILAESLPDQLTVLLTRNSGGRSEFVGFIADDARFSIAVKDVVDGDTQVGSPMFDTSGDAKTNGAEIVDGTFSVSCGDTAGNFFIKAANFAPPYSYPLPSARTYVGKAQLSIRDSVGDELLAIDLLGLHYPDPDDTTWPSNRVYLESVAGLEVGDKLIVKGTGDEDHSPYILDIQTIDTSNRYIEISMAHTGSFYLSSDMSFSKITRYPLDNDIAGFVQSVCDASVNANLGATPWITENDVDAPGWNDIYLNNPVHTYWRHRAYQFVSPVTVREVIVPELQVAGWMARLNSDGRLGLAQMPFVSAQRTAQHRITDDDILYPAAGMVGQWPTWEAQNDGLVNIAYLKLGYSPFTDEYDPHFDFIVRLTDSISEHKSGDKAKQEIGPKSAPSSGGTLKKRLADLPSANEIADMVLPYLQTLSKDYATVTIAVPFTKFGVLCGDIVSITSANLPDGLGGRGVSGKKAICVGRDWNLDPAQNAMGLLTFWFPRDSGRTAGYAPTGRVTSQSNTTGNIWVLTFSAANMYNIAWSEDNDGDIVKHFAVDDRVQIVEVDKDSAVVLFGEVSAIPNTSQIEVTFVGTWTPSSSTWNLRFAPNESEAGTGFTNRQRQYAIVADPDGFVDGATPARSFV